MVKIKEIIENNTIEEGLNLTTTLRSITWDPYIVIRILLIIIVASIILYTFFSIISSIKNVSYVISDCVDGNKNRKKND